jgi:hypothetical protein
MMEENEKLREREGREKKDKKKYNIRKHSVYHSATPASTGKHLYPPKT